jgi:hypothetical protein
MKSQSLIFFHLLLETNEEMIQGSGSAFNSLVRGRVVVIACNSPPPVRDFWSEHVYEEDRKKKGPFG